MENPIVTKDADYLAIWVYLLLNATHDSYPVLFKGEKITLESGQLLTGRKTIANRLSISESKVTRVLKIFEDEHQIEQQTSNKNRLITIVNWEFYQGGEHQNRKQIDDLTTIEQQMDNNRTATEQQLNNNRTTTEHKQEDKECKEYEEGKECKNKKSSKGESVRQIFDRLILDYSISHPLVEKMKEWIAYKIERKESYKEQGMKALLRRVEKEEQSNGADIVINLIDECMGNGWKGIIWDRLSNMQKNGSKRQVNNSDYSRDEQFNSLMEQIRRDKEYDG